MVYAYRLPEAGAFAAIRGGLETTPLSGAMEVADPRADPMFDRIALSVNGTATIGTQIIAADLDHDGDIDIATAGKLGVHVLENLKVNNVSHAVREETQPLDRKWPFSGEGSEVPQEDGPSIPR